VAGGLITASKLGEEMQQGAQRIAQNTSKEHTCHIKCFKLCLWNEDVFLFQKSEPSKHSKNTSLNEMLQHIFETTLLPCMIFSLLP
jgi:hypothetical protein